MTPDTAAVPPDQIPGFDLPHRILPAARREDLRRIVEETARAGGLAALIRENYASFFRCPLPRFPPSPASLVVAAVPHPSSRVPFAWRGRAFSLPVPPGVREVLVRLGLEDFFGLRECLEMLRAKLAVFLPRIESRALPSRPLDA